MRKIKLFAVTAMLAGTMFVTGACGNASSDNTKSSTTKEDTQEQTDVSENTSEESEQEEGKAADGSSMDMKGVTTAKQIDGFDQTAMPKKGDTIATISVEKFGDIKVRFFEEIAPYGVKNFINHAKEGYYDGLTFHRVIDDFMIQGGDPTGNGTGGESIWGKEFYNELSDQALVIRGSLCYANTGMDPSNGSQFFITQAKKVTEEQLKKYEEEAGLKLTDEQKKVYLEKGGCPWLQGGYTVFGQVIDGMDVVDKIAAVDADEDTNKPKEDVIISSVKVSKYKGK